MLTPLSQSWPAHYYDGVSANRRDVTVRLGPQSIEIQDPRGEPIIWPYDEIVQSADTFSSDLVRLERKRDGTEMLIVRDRRFAHALRQSAPPEWSAQSRVRSGPSWERTAVAALAVLVLAVAFYVWGAHALGGLFASVLPVSWEERMGHGFAQTLAPDSERCSDADAIAALETIVARLTKAVENSPYEYRVAIGGISVNAFAAPGGYVVVTPGLLEMTDRPEQLAGVLAHEIEHVERRPSTPAIFRDMSGTLILAALTGEFTSGSMALQSAATLTELSHARDNEMAADIEGMRLLQKARIDGQGMIEMFQKFQEFDGMLPTQLQYVSTHPITSERVRVLQRVAGAADYAPVELLPGTDWEQVKNACRP